MIDLSRAGTPASPDRHRGRALSEIPAFTSIVWPVSTPDLTAPATA
ncbi:hypothetical protein RHOER0001_3857 [Rhodococcus erythropolis SK121]|nr:hypothetical protein RHOER0001_3857 [Rhodococcus erythropolis SK121]